MTNARFAVPGSPRRGVTLIELVVVCLIVTIVTAVTIPVLARTGSTSAANEQPTRIEDELTRCREIAIERGGRVRVVVDSMSSVAWMGIRSNDGVEWTGPTSIDSSLVLKSSHAEFACYSTGAVQGPNFFLGHGRERHTVVIDPMAGRLSVR